MTICRLLSLLILVLCFINCIYPWCGQKIGSANEHGRIIAFYPLTVSRYNDSYDMNMIAKEVAYAKEYENHKELNKFGRVIYDYCNDLSILMQIQTGLILGSLEDVLESDIDLILILGKFVILKSAIPLLELLDISIRAVITDKHKTKDIIHYYPYRDVEIYTEEKYGYTLKSELQKHTYQIEIHIGLCYPKNKMCKCMPLERNAPGISLFTLYLGDYQDFMKLKSLLVSSRKAIKAQNVRLVIRRRSTKDWPGLAEQVKAQLNDTLINLELEKGSFYRYSSYKLNCNGSMFLNKTTKDKYCQDNFTIKTLSFSGYANYDTYIIPDWNLKNYTCKPTCSAGKTISFTDHTYLCKLCIGNKAKPIAGNHECTPCKRGWTPNKRKTLCIDTYENKSLDLSGVEAIVMLFLSCLMFAFVSFCLYLFMKHKDTPIVKSSNLQLSVLQLLTQIAIVVTTPFVFMTKPSTILCMLRPSCVGVLFTIAFTITMSKLKALLRIFQSQSRLTPEERRETKITEYFILVLFVIVDVVVLILSFQFRAISAKLLVLDKQKIREKRCSTNVHIFIQLGFIFILLVFNSIQAIRARHLPANFKETRVIMLANLLSIVIVGNIAWLTITETHHQQSIYLFYAMFLLNGINFITMYGYKVYIILFLSHLNTRQYFMECIRRRAIELAEL